MKSYIAYIFTTFPKKSEIFLHREIDALLKKNISLDIYSLINGNKVYRNKKIFLFRYTLLPLIIYYFLYWIIKKPLVIFFLLKKILLKKKTSIINFLENIFGFISGIILSNSFIKKKYKHIHAVWASMPAMCAWTISKLTKIPFSMGAHAYDIFENNGDNLLIDKSKDSKFIHTSTKTAKYYLRSLGIENKKIYVIYRGIFNIRSYKKQILLNKICHISSIGRFIEKKGFLKQLSIYKELKKSNFLFKTSLIGNGPLMSKIKKLIKKFYLMKYVKLIGWISNDKITTYLDKTDIFIFTGIISKNGDRDGIPNVILEAMSRGIPIIANYSKPLSEIIINGYNGYLLNNKNNNFWIKSIKQLFYNKKLYQKISKRSIQCIKYNFNAKKNINTIIKLIKKKL